MHRSWSRIPWLWIFVLLLLGSVDSPARAQTAGLDCDQCPGASSLSAWTCPVEEFIEEGSGCSGFNNCQTPDTSQHGVEVIESSPGVFQARLVVEVEAPWNSNPDLGSNSTLDLWWNTGGTATHPTANLCEHLGTDRVGILHLPRTPDAEALATELLEYEIQVAEDANERYGAFRVGTQDDLVTALGLAVQEDPPVPHQPLRRIVFG